MPQLDIATFFPQIFWLIISFAILYLILSQFFLPKLEAVNQRRELNLADAIIAAEQNKEEAQRLKSEYEKKISEAIQQKNTIISEAMKDINKMVELKMAEHKIDLEKIQEESSLRIAQIKKESLDSAKQIAIESTQNIISNLLDMKLTNAEITNLVENQIKEQNHVN